MSTNAGKNNIHRSNMARSLRFLDAKVWHCWRIKPMKAKTINFVNQSLDFCCKHQQLLGRFKRPHAELLIQRAETCPCQEGKPVVLLQRNRGNPNNQSN